MRYKIALQYSDEGFSVSVPGLPGCWSQSSTEQEALMNIQDAITDYLVDFPDFVWAFHDRDEIGPRMLSRIAKRTGPERGDL
jgi:predicted RNase H-like HicB family nuclease